MSRRTLGYTTTERLYQATGKLCHRIAARHRQSGKAHWWRKPGAQESAAVPWLKEILEESLNLTNQSPFITSPLARYSNDGYFSKSFRSFAQPSAKRCEMEHARLDEWRRTLEKPLEKIQHPLWLNLVVGWACTTHPPC